MHPEVEVGLAIGQLAIQISLHLKVTVSTNARDTVVQDRVQILLPNLNVLYGCIVQSEGAGLKSSQLPFNGVGVERPSIIL